MAARHSGSPTILSFDELNRVSQAVAPMVADLGRDSTPFDRTDDIARAQVRQVVREMARMRSRIAARRKSGDDAYVCMEIVYATYATLWAGYSRALQAAWLAAYRTAVPQGGSPDAARAFSDWSQSYVMPDGFVPIGEWERKRARAFESVVANVRGGGSLATSVGQSQSAWCRQLRQGADDMTNLGMVAAYVDAGVSRVEFVTQRDARVCEECRAYDGHVFELGKQPSLPLHHNCRCFYIPAGRVVVR